MAKQQAEMMKEFGIEGMGGGDSYEDPELRDLNNMLKRQGSQDMDDDDDLMAQLEAAERKSNP